jgi:hypothetical protein
VFISLKAGLQCQRFCVRDNSIGILHSLCILKAILKAIKSPGLNRETRNRIHNTSFVIIFYLI